MTDSQDKIAAAHAEFEQVFRPQEEKRTNEAKEAISSKEMNIDVEGFQFRITTKILPKHIRLLSEAKSNFDESNPDYDKLMDPFVRFMASICTDKSLDESFWAKYDEDTGFLPDIVEYIVKSVDHYKPSIKSFR